MSRVALLDCVLSDCFGHLDFKAGPRLGEVTQHGEMGTRQSKQTPSQELAGIWEFYWETLPDSIHKYTPQKDSSNYLLVPGLWQRYPNIPSIGFATYRVEVLLPKNLPIMAFSIPSLTSSYRLFADGELITQTGIPGTTCSTTTPDFETKTINFKAEKESIELVLQISNFHHARGGFGRAIQFGESEYMHRQREQLGNFAYLMTGSVFMGGLFFLGLFLFGRENRDVLLFALFCIIYSYRICGSDMYFLKMLFRISPTNGV